MEVERRKRIPRGEEVKVITIGRNGKQIKLTFLEVIIPKYEVHLL